MRRRCVTDGLSKRDFAGDTRASFPICRRITIAKPLGTDVTGRCPRRVSPISAVVFDNRLRYGRDVGKRRKIVRRITRWVDRAPLFIGRTIRRRERSRLKRSRPRACGRRRNESERTDCESNITDTVKIKIVNRLQHRFRAVIDSRPTTLCVCVYMCARCVRAYDVRVLLNNFVASIYYCETAARIHTPLLRRFRRWTRTCPRLNTRRGRSYAFPIGNATP